MRRRGCEERDKLYEGVDMCLPCVCVLDMFVPPWKFSHRLSVSVCICVIYIYVCIYLKPISSHVLNVLGVRCVCSSSVSWSSTSSPESSGRRGSRCGMRSTEAC